MGFPWTNFAEIPLQDLMFGQTLPASTLSQINKNSQQAVLTPEFFEPADYEDSDVIPLPTSTIDGYTYLREELLYIWEWRSQDANSTGSHFRIPGFYATIDTNGLVHIKVWRLKSGGPYVTEPDGGDANLKLHVLVIGVRGHQNPAIAVPTDGSPSDSGDIIADDDGSNDTVEGS